MPPKFDPVQLQEARDRRSQLAAVRRGENGLAAAAAASLQVPADAVREQSDGSTNSMLTATLAMLLDHVKVLVGTPLGKINEYAQRFFGKVVCKDSEMAAEFKVHVTTITKWKRRLACMAWSTSRAFRWKAYKLATDAGRRCDITLLQTVDETKYDETAMRMRYKDFTGLHRVVQGQECDGFDFQ
jgi:hypothetical protein